MTPEANREMSREVASLRATLEAHLFGGFHSRPFSPRLSLILDGLVDLQERLADLDRSIGRRAA